MTAILPAIESYLASHRFVSQEHVRGAALAIISAMAKFTILNRWNVSTILLL